MRLAEEDWEHIVIRFQQWIDLRVREGQFT